MSCYPDPFGSRLLSYHQTPTAFPFAECHTCHVNPASHGRLLGKLYPASRSKPQQWKPEDGLPFQTMETLRQSGVRLFTRVLFLFFWLTLKLENILISCRDNLTIRAAWFRVKTTIIDERRCLQRLMLLNVESMVLLHLFNILLIRYLASVCLGIGYRGSCSSSDLPDIWWCDSLKYWKGLYCTASD